ncbi:MULTISPECIES: amidohydrolase [Edwardsiella]|uniref:N-acyl-L-amino acid amidohydrolase n=2 Tax=Edwardsiella anguillarum TaxID=1821960 RepID=A0A076LIQ7_9GAMM|nr:MULTISPECIES: amidohydrolase [Edwardsiella]AIJ06772.1 N-acyl-L-amino acid amidohydrolase [Edwardsiella anguillarum ET080813]KAB0593374.1 amidohydrolase [Edwardsiella anguillarum]UBU94618.1 amidohydrolase [Edwardsiella sp. LADL05-105]UOU77944.1 amidohydrolase [Edwardsiella anguillarum]WHP82659.1 amidohydrolase [Edwardsiella anguillarum]
MSHAHLLDALQPHAAAMIPLRRQLHRYLELSGSESQTADLLASHLSQWGYRVTRAIGGHGLVATLQAGQGERTLGLRADMDALPIQERGERAWLSRHPGVAHSCGHDGHCAILLCAAHYLAEQRRFNGTLHLIFQPAEERLSGAQAMIADGLFERFPCDALFALHNMPNLAGMQGEVGDIAIRPGPLMAASDELEIVLSGVGGHGAFPQLCIDATLVASHLVVALQSIVARNTDPLQAAVVTVGSLQSGQAANVISDKALLRVSVRSLQPALRQQTLQRIEQLTHAIAAAFGAQATIVQLGRCPCVVNHPDASHLAYRSACALLGEPRVHQDPPLMMGSEDFALLLEQVPWGAYVLVYGGAGGAALHQPEFDFNDAILLPAAAFWCALVADYLR